MESIVLHSDIVRLVFGYFVNNNLRRAALTLCRTSPHLHQEFIALRQGLQPHNFLKEGLEDIIREHVRITSMVTNAVKKLPNETRQRLQQLKLSERVDELLKLNKASTRTRACSKDGTACMRNVYPNTQRKRRRVCVHSPLGDEQTNSAAPSPSVNCKRRRLLDPHLYCSIGRSNHVEEEKESLDSSTASELTSEDTDDTLHFRHGHVNGPKNNSTPRTATSEEADLVIPTPQTMPELTQAIMTNREFQNKLLSNINIALQSLTVHAPTAESVNSEAVLDGLVRNILEATEKDPSFDRIIQEVVGMDTLTDEPIPAAVEPSAEIAPGEIEPVPPQTPLIIRTAVASANAAAGSVNACGDINMVNGGNGNAIIQINANSSIGTLMDPNFSISKLIVLNSNESAQKQNQMQSSNNLSFGSENLISFADGGSTLADADSVGNVAAQAGGQVCVDATNGQLTFPMFLSNEGLLSHLPFLVNNEWLAQQLRSDTITNVDVSHIEIPLPEPITIAVNQLPPNSIIINSAVKQQLTTVEEPAVEPPAQLIADQEKTVTGNTTLLEHSASKVSTASAVPASLDLSRLVLERVTPSTSGIVNVKAFRSLSTPRKRTSHVRTLNFSPKGIPHLQGSTPLSTRRLQQKPQTQRRTQLKTLRGKKEEEFKETGLHPEKTVLIKNMEALPSCGTTPSVPPATNANGAIVDATALTTTPADVCGNESNGCVPPLFVMEECSNQTVIKAATTYKQLKLATNTSDTMVTTPKRKQKRSAATNACKRIISQAVIQDEPNVQQQMEIEKRVSSLPDDSKENESWPTTLQKQLPEQKTELNKEKEDLLAAWQRQMNSTSVDLELRLREINAKRQEVLQNKTSVRRTRPAGANKKKALALSSPLSPLTTKKRKQNQKKKQHLSSNNRMGAFNIKITTPHKSPVKPEFVSQHQNELKEVKKPKEVEKPKDSKKIKDKTNKEIVETEQNHEPEPVQQIQQHLQQPEALKLNIKNKPVDCNMANMAVLLETPFKVSVKEADGDVPPTPEPMLMDTPFAKLLPSASFLFGSDTKSILDTPMLTAITPGMRLMTPFGHVLGTPHSSAAKTDYSSGSSYYRPDEAEHTRTNAQSALLSASPRDLLGQIPKQRTNCFKLHAKRVPVEPMVLRRVRSFGSEAVDSVEGAAALYRNGELSTQLVETPHYKLVAGLPDVVDHSNSSSSVSSSTSSSSSSSSSSGSSSNSNTINTSASSASSGQMTSATTPARMLKLLALENLSDISSTEDEEWLKVATGCGSLDAPPLAIDSEPAQLVSQDGEVRYPLRSWLTPSKEADAAAAAAVAEVDTSGETAPPAPEPLKVVPNVKSPNIGKLREESVEQRIMDLAEVCERVKAKFKQQKTPKGRRRTVNKRLTTMRETCKLTNPNRTHANNSPKKESTSVNTVKKSKVSNKNGPRNHETSPSKSMKPNLAKPSEAIESILEKIEPPNSNLDPALLFALNLSAKKQQQQQQPKVGCTAVQIEAQPALSMTMGQRRGRPKKPPNLEPTRGSMRRSSRLIDNKTPAPEEPQPIGSETAKPVKISNNTKVTKKPAKKRTDARIETAAPPLATLAEAQTTQQSTAKLQPRRQLPASITAPDASGDYDLNMCLSRCHVTNTYSFVYSDSGCKAVHAVPWQPPSFFKNFQMRIMVDSEMHNVRITSPQLLHQSLCVSVDNSANPTCIRNIPKKRIIRFTSGGGGSQELAPAPNFSLRSSTPLANHTQGEEHDDNDMEVASINTPLKANTSEEQQMEGHDAGVQIEDIESILSHLHGT